LKLVNEYKKGEEGLDVIIEANDPRYANVNKVKRDI